MSAAASNASPMHATWFVGRLVANVIPFQQSWLAHSTLHHTAESSFWNVLHTVTPTLPNPLNHLNPNLHAAIVPSMHLPHQAAANSTHSPELFALDTLPRIP